MNHVPTPSSSAVADAIQAAASRRTFLRRAGLAGAASAFAPAAASLLMGTRSSLADDATSLDIDILNFALNLEYLEAEYYSYAVNGIDIASTNPATPTTGTGASGATLIKANPKVQFSNPVVAEYAAEIAQDEINHVKFLHSALGSMAVAKPALDLQSSFNMAAQAAEIGDVFDPFVNDVTFLIGAFIFEDVGVTAYHGAAALLTSKTYLSAAAGILAVEAYHASEVRTILYGLSQQQSGSGIVETVQKISNLRDMVDNKKDKDQGITLDGTETGVANIVPTDENSIAYSRSARQVLNIVYGGHKAKQGLFFPAGMNGNIK